MRLVRPHRPSGMWLQGAVAATVTARVGTKQLEVAVSERRDARHTVSARPNTCQTWQVAVVWCRGRATSATVNRRILLGLCHDAGNP